MMTELAILGELIEKTKKSVL